MTSSFGAYISKSDIKSLTTLFLSKFIILYIVIILWVVENDISSKL